MYLISIGADIHYKNSNGITALFYVAINDAVKICQYLIDNGAIINYQATFEKQTPLIKAVYYDRIVITEMLLEHGARVEIKDYYTIIHENLVFLAKIIVQGRLNFDNSSQKSVASSQQFH